MAEYVSEAKSIVAPRSAVYAKLSDLSNLNALAEMLPEGKVNLTAVDSDSCTLSINPVGQIALRIAERKPDNLIRFEADRSPIPLDAHIQLDEATPGNTKLTVMLKAELNMFVKPMLDKPLREGVDKLAMLLSSLKYA